MVFQVHITDGVQFVRESTKFLAADANGVACENRRAPLNGDCIASRAENRGDTKVDVFITDVDSPDSR